jgi:NADH-quinone oxidoreductase subunit F
MAKLINNPQELETKYAEFKSLLSVRNDPTYTGDQKSILVCGGAGCISLESSNIINEFQKLIDENHLGDKVTVAQTGCFGFCEQGPIVKIFPDQTFYVQVKPKDAHEIFQKHILEGSIVERLLYIEPKTKQKMVTSDEMPFYKQQKKIALRNCGLIDLEKIEEYIGVGGYLSLSKVLSTMTPEQAIEEMKKSGLSGRGGAGFSTGRKWEFGRVNKGDRKYVICNADEGDPGAFMDRSILEGNAHTVLEGMAIAGYCIGASKGYVYVRAEYPLAIKRVQIAINEAMDYGLLGKDILGSGFDFEVEIRLGVWLKYRWAQLYAN